MLNIKSPKAGFGRFQLFVLILAIALAVFLLIPFYNSYVTCMESEKCKPSDSTCNQKTVTEADSNQSKNTKTP
jgi:hypothetical protein